MDFWYNQDFSNFPQSVCRKEGNLATEANKSNSCSSKISTLHSQISPTKAHFQFVSKWKSAKIVMKFLIDEMINDDQIAHMQMIMIMTGNSAIQYLKMKFNDY